MEKWRSGKSGEMRGIVDVSIRAWEIPIRLGS